MARLSTAPLKSLDPRGYLNILGSTFANHDHQPLVKIGTRTWTRWQLGRLGCPHPAAAVRVQRVIETLRITTEKAFVEQAGEFGKFETLGVTCYWVVLALVADCGGSIEKAHGAEESFASVHKRALRAMQPTSADKKVRGPSEAPLNGKARRRTA